MKAGAFDYVTKPVSRDELLLTVDKALRMRRLASENVNLRAELASREGFGSLVGRSPGVREAIATAVKVAATDATVLPGRKRDGEGAHGAGIHAGSPQAGGPFVAINCAAIPEGLVESEMFGHVRGAFTGAVRDRAGKFEEAHGGTLFLDEIGDLKPDLQAKLLRVSETRVVERVGGGKPVAVDVRLIAATHRDLAEMIRKGEFREDSTTASRSCRSRSRRSAKGRRTFPSSSITSFGSSTGRRGSRWTRTFWPSSSATPGPETSASWRTSSSGPPFSERGRESRGRIFLPVSARRSPSRPSTRAGFRTGRSRSTGWSGS